MEATYYFTVPSDIDTSVIDFLRGLMRAKKKLNLYAEREEALFMAKLENPKILIMKTNSNSLFSYVQVYSEEQNFICSGSEDYFRNDCVVWE